MGKVKQWSVEKKDAIETMLINMWASLGMDIPDNYEDIVQYCYEDVCETADPKEWHSGDVSIAFRRWIEAQAMSDTGMKDSDGNKIKIDDSIVRSEEDGMYRVECKNGISLGDTLQTVGQLRELMSDLDDHDQICIETCDEDGDQEDLYPMSLDIIEGIELTDKTIVREVRFCQRPNSEPDTRDKQPLIDEVIKQIKDDIEEQDLTALDELLKFLPWEILKNYIPEDQWEKFNSENFNRIDIDKFKNEWGQDHVEICANLGYDTEGSDELLMEDYFWLPDADQWYPKSSSMYTERQQAIADFLRN